MTKKKTVRISRDKVLSTKDLITEALIPEVKKKCFIQLGRKAMMNLDSVLKSRDITLPTKVHIVKAMVFLVVMYGCESWMIKAECQRIYAFNLWC